MCSLLQLLCAASVSSPGLFPVSLIRQCCSHYKDILEHIFSCFTCLLLSKGTWIFEVRSFHLVIVQFYILGGLFHDTLCSVSQTLHNTTENYIMLNGVYLICSANCQERLECCREMLFFSRIYIDLTELWSCPCHHYWLMKMQGSKHSNCLCLQRKYLPRLSY